jgi:hypothetical protein
MKPLTDQERSILAKHATGATFPEIAAEFGVSRAIVRRVVEYRGRVHAEGAAKLAIDPENLEGLRQTAAITERTYGAIANATYTVDVPDLERLSDIAAQGRECVARFPKIGPGVMAELDTVLASFGIAWNPRPRPFAYRTDENKHPLLKMWDQGREWREQQDNDAQHWSNIVRRVAEIERAVGTAVLEDIQGRDGMQGVSVRLAFLTGYLGGYFENRARKPMRDITPEPDDGDYETAGNLICLPGVKLADVLTDGAAS